MNLLRLATRCVAPRLLLAAAVLLVAAAHAAPVERTLGDGLVYFRVHTVPDDLPGRDPAQTRACILDLRYAAGTPAAAVVFGGWLRFHCSARTPVFVLVNDDCAAPLREVLHHAALPGLLTFGIAGQSTAPDITVTQSTTAERRAYEAFEHGTGIAALTTDHPDKQRYDEASLAQERSGDQGDVVPGDDDSPIESDQPPAKKPAPPTDAALERAIHVYQGLRAMKRL